MVSVPVQAQQVLKATCQLQQARGPHADTQLQVLLESSPTPSAKKQLGPLSRVKSPVRFAGFCRDEMQATKDGE